MAVDSRDTWPFRLIPGSWPGETIKNQVEYNVNDQVECDKVGEAPPCDIRYYPLFYPFRGVDLWGSAGVIFDNPEYPVGQKCPWETLPE